MGGMFGAVSKRDCVMDLFFGTDYHSHLGTKRGGMCLYNQGKFELDVVSDKTAEDLASILSDRGCEIDGVSGSLVEGRGAEVPAP